MPLRTHEDTLRWAESVEEGLFTSLMGITGKSVFTTAHGFMLVHDILPEPMHLLDGGFMKSMCAKIFKATTNTNIRITNYRKTSTVLLSSLIT
jgi:hypothetical protein